MVSLTWNLLVELNGTSKTFLSLARSAMTPPYASSVKRSSADSDASPRHSLHQTSHAVADRQYQYCDCVSVRQHISTTTRRISTPISLLVLPMAVAQSSSGGVTVCCVFPVLWTTS